MNLSNRDMKLIFVLLIFVSNIFLTPLAFADGQSVTCSGDNCIPNPPHNNGDCSGCCGGCGGGARERTLRPGSAAAACRPASSVGRSQNNPGPGIALASPPLSLLSSSRIK